MAIETSIVKTEVVETKKPAYKVVVPEFHDISPEKEGKPALIFKRGQDISHLTEEKVEQYLAAGAIQKNED